VLTELNLKSRETDGVRGIINPWVEEVLPERLSLRSLRTWKSLSLRAKVVPYSPALAGVHTKMATPIIPKTKNALFRIVDKFFIMVWWGTLFTIRYKEAIVKENYYKKSSFLKVALPIDNYRKPLTVILPP